MIEQIAALPVAPAVPAGALPSLSPPSALVVERFNAVMNAAPAVPSPAAPLPSVLQMTFTPPAAEPQTLGNQILGKLQAFSTEYGQRWQRVASDLNHMVSQPSIAKALGLQAELLQISVETEFMGKMVGGIPQKIDTLIRMS